MILSDSDIRTELQLGSLFIENIQEGAIQPASVDLHLDSVVLNEVTDSQGKVVIPKKQHQEFITTTCDEGFILYPGAFVLGSTIEKVKFGAGLTGYVIAKSSLARIGLNVLPGLIDPGFNGTITLEIFSTSTNPIRLDAGMRICQLTVFTNRSRAKDPYGSANHKSSYQNQQGATQARPADF